MANINQKDKQVSVYYADNSKGKLTKHYIHAKNRGLWAFVRDLSQSEKIQHQTKDAENTLFFELNSNAKIMKNYAAPIIIEFRGNAYKCTVKPDEFTYDSSGTIRIKVVQSLDWNKYDEVIYDK